jgi:hypothetical protein
MGRLDMERKSRVLFITLLLCLTSLVIIPDDNEVKANPGGGNITATLLGRK